MEQDITRGGWIPLAAAASVCQELEEKFLNLGILLAAGLRVPTGAVVSDDSDLDFGRVAREVISFVEHSDAHSFQRPKVDRRSHALSVRFGDKYLNNNIPLSVCFIDPVPSSESREQLRQFLISIGSVELIEQISALPQADQIACVLQLGFRHLRRGGATRSAALVQRTVSG